MSLDLRTVDRLHLGGEVNAQQSVALREGVYRLTAALEIVGVTRPVLARAGQPLPAPLGSLGALHLATALLWSETLDLDLVMLTHDRALAQASSALGLECLGASGL